MVTITGQRLKISSKNILLEQRALVKFQLMLVIGEICNILVIKPSDNVGSFICLAILFLVIAFYQNEPDYYSGKLFFSSDHRMYA